MPQTRFVHPVADLFPMLDGEDLADLAASISERGQEHPIVLDKGGRILDGRNRLAACEQIGVEPKFTTYEGSDPDGYALTVNLARRHLTKGQRAMVAARAALVSNAPKASVARSANLERTRVAQAGTVLEHAEHLADAVIAGAVSLDKAYEEAKRKKAEKQSEAERAAADKAALERLREAAPDLATRVVEDGWALNEATVAYKERERWERENRLHCNTAFATAVTALGSIVDPIARQRVIEWWDPELCESPPYDVNPEQFRAIGEGLIAAADLLEKK